MSMTCCKQHHHGDTDMTTKHDGENVNTHKKIFIECITKPKECVGVGGGGKSFNDCTDSGRTFNHLYNIVQKILDQFLVGIHD